MSFARALKRVRIDKRMTQADFAYMLEVPFYTYVSWERGKNLPSFAFMDDLLSMFGTFSDERSALSKAYTDDKLRKTLRAAKRK